MKEGVTIKPQATQIMEAEDCENDKVLLVLTDGQLTERYAGLCSIDSGVFVGYDGKYVVHMYACGEGKVGSTFIEDNQSFQLVNE
jgi:hypothetical protein